MVSIITEMRMITGFIHEESGNPYSDIRLYITDLASKIQNSKK